MNTRPIRTLPRTADLVFGPTRIAVFIDGCYWHGCPTHFKLPKTNQAYWSAKINGNRLRDRDTDETLRSAGWTSLRFWEHQSPEEIASAISEAVRHARQSRDVSIDASVTRRASPPMRQ